MEWVAPEGSKLVVEGPAGVQLADQVIVFDDQPVRPAPPPRPPPPPPPPPKQDLLAFPQNRTPQENFARSVAESQRGQAVIDDLEVSIERSRAMALRGTAVYMGILFFPVAVGEAVAATSIGGTLFFGAAAVYDLDQLQSGVRELGTGEPTPSGYNQAVRGIAEVSGASPDQAADIATGVELGTAGVFLVGGAFGGSQGRNPRLDPPEPRSLGSAAAKRTKQGGAYSRVFCRLRHGSRSTD